MKKHRKIASFCVRPPARVGEQRIKKLFLLKKKYKTVNIGLIYDGFKIPELKNI